MSTLIVPDIHFENRVPYFEKNFNFNIQHFSLQIVVERIFYTFGPHMCKMTRHPPKLCTILQIKLVCKVIKHKIDDIYV